ncbi:MAG TPA: formylglycine-generating enzyme family protein [Clostridiales bacterium]|nr:formylglycine-generating enzyme family protein [Clostridiales bacterium]HQP68818.1 formylglycine-generating enzyme family protein [Clostridiales bacterium]
MKKVKLILIFLITVLTFSAQFKIVKDVYEDTGSITAQRYGYKDHNGDYVAILKVKTDIENLAFKSMTLDKSEYMGNGIYHVYMQPGSRMLEFIKTDFISLKHQFPRQLASNKVYILEVSGVGEEKKIEDITINLIGEPENSNIFLDGSEKGSVKSIKTTVGKHELKVISEGYETYKKIIEVSTDKTMFEYKLEKIQNAKFEINSNPPGAVVYIDSIRIGETPLPAYHPEGTYRIRIDAPEGYEDIEETVIIKRPETKKTYQLADIRATLTINTHEKAKVYLNGQQITEYKNIKLPPKEHSVKIEMSKVQPVEKKISLKRNEKKTIDLFPQIFTGTVQITVIPEGANIELSEAGGEKYTSTGSKSFSNVPAGTYRLKVSKKGFKTAAEDVIVTKDAKINKKIKLEEGYDAGKDFVFVEGGKFQMGSNMWSDEGPPHDVTLNDYYISKTEVTQAQYQELTGKNPSEFKGENNPVDQLSWYEAVEFCNKLSEKEGLEKCYSGSGDNIICNFKADGYRLPTEAEWEYAARGGNKSEGFEYSGSKDINEVAEYAGNNDKSTKKVAGKKPNELGIYDMSGNMEEWCWDRYDYYSDAESADQKGPDSKDITPRVLRGGHWMDNVTDGYLKCTGRYSGSPESRSVIKGFRVARNFSDVIK